MSRRRRPKKKERKSNLRDLSVPLTELSLEVFRDSDGERLDSFLCKQLSWRSKTSVQDLIQSGKVTVSGRPQVKKSTRLRSGDMVILQVPKTNDVIRHQEIAEGLDFLYEDEDLVAINKSPRLVVHPVGRVRNNTLIQALHWHYRHGPGLKGQKPVVPKICHRLDRNTSGVIVLAKTDKARRRIQEIFEARQLSKRYLTLLRGRVEEDDQRVDAPIGPFPESGHGMKMTVRDNGLPSRSRFRCLERLSFEGEDYSFCEVGIETGRQHQIRVHAIHLGHPVVCDALYTGQEQWSSHDGELLLDRQALHAAELRFRHPISGEELDLRAALPEDMGSLLERMRAG